MPRSRSRTLAALAVAFLLLAALTGCGNDAEPSGSGSVDKAPGTTVDTNAFVDDLLAVVKEQRTARAELTLGAGISAEAAFRYGARPAADLAFELLGRRIRLVLVDDLVYLQQSAGEKFVVLSRDDPSLEAFGGGLAEADPQKVLAGLAESITQVREIGPATVEGEKLTRYAVTVDAEEVGSGMLGMLPGVDLDDGLVLDLYVDGDNLLHRVAADLGQNDLTLVITDWGKPVTITAPSAAEILKN